MRRHALLSSAALSLVLALGCLGIGNKDIEGDEAGECSDGADNDQNGLFDCDDEGCFGSPDCEEEVDDTGIEGDTDTDADADTDTDADADADADSDADVDEVAGHYFGDVSLLLLNSGDDGKCTGEFELAIESSGRAEGYGPCVDGDFAVGAHVFGEVQGEDFFGEATFEGAYPFEGLEVEIEGVVAEGWAQLEFQREVTAADWLVIGVFVAERD